MSERNLRPRKKVVETTAETEVESSSAASEESAGSDENYRPGENASEYEDEATAPSAKSSEESASSYEFSSGDSATERKQGRIRAPGEAEETADIFDPPETRKIHSILAKGVDENGEEVFLVKFQNLSYHHCGWLSRSAIENADISARTMLIRFRKKEAERHVDDAHAHRDFSGRFLFDPLALQVDRVIHHRLNVEEFAFAADELGSSTAALFEAGLALVSAIAVPSATDAEDARKSYAARLRLPQLSRFLLHYVGSGELEPSKRYRVFVEYLVKWRAQSITKCTWEDPAELFREARDAETPAAFEATRYAAKKDIEQYLQRDELVRSIVGAAKRYEEINDVKAKMARMSMAALPKAWKDPRSVRKGRPAQLSGGREFSEWAPPAYKGGNELKSYQVEGVKWMIYNWHKKRNCILADEMGLGKTIQTICFIEYLFREQKLRGPFIIISPKSTLKNWQREFEKWTDYNVLTYDGPKMDRKIIDSYDFFFDDDENPSKTVPFVTKFDVVITSYGLMLTEKILTDIDYGLFVVDEAHRLKNPESSLYQKIAETAFQHCVLLTGTPLQNNIGELWALLSIIEPSIFHNQTEFEAKYDTAGEDSAERIHTLHTRVLKPFMLRRVKNDVEATLQTPKEIVIWLRLTRVQKKYFRAIFEQNTDFLHAQGRKNSPSLVNIFMQLRHCCNHPFVMKGVEERTLAELGVKDHAGEVMRALVQVSCKMDFLDKFLPMMQAQGHKVLLFSQFVLILDIIDDFLNFKGYRYERIDGNVDLDARQNAIDRFNSEESNFIFLLSTRAGGLGINLTSADTVIIYDSDWNPQNDLQAQARAHRIGQTKKVTIYRLVTKGTYEEVMLQKAGKKLGLEKALLHSWIKSGREKEKGQSGDLDKDELEKLIRFGAYHVLKDTEDDNKPQAIEEILASSEVLQPQETTHDRSETVFSQATFKNTLDDNLSLDDPDFWRKIGLKKSTQKQIQYGRRKRNRVERNAHYRPAEISSASSQSSSESGDSFDSDDKDRWSRVQRNAFDEALIRFGYGRWDKIRSANDLKKPVAACKEFALGLISLFVKQRGRMSVSFLKSLKADLLEVATRPAKADSSDESDDSDKGVVDDLAFSRFGGAAAQTIDLVGDDIVEMVETKRKIFLKDVFQLLQDLKLDPVLESQKWQKTRFSKTKVEELRILEHCWIVKTLVENPKIELPNDVSDKTLPLESWGPEDDIFCLNLCYQHGYDNWYSSFPSKYKKHLSEKQLKKAANPTETELNPENLAKNAQKSENLAENLAKNAQKSENSAENPQKSENLAQNDQKTDKTDRETDKTASETDKTDPETDKTGQTPTQTALIPLRGKIKKRFLSFLFRAKPNVQNFLREQQKRIEALSVQKHKNIAVSIPEHSSLAQKGAPKMTKSLARSFRRFVTTFPVRNPGLEASWRFFDGGESGRGGRQPCESSPEYLDLRDHGMGAKEMWDAFKKFRWEVDLFLRSKMDPSTASVFEMTLFAARRHDARLRMFENVFRLLGMNGLRERLAKISGASSPAARWAVPESDVELLKGIVKHGFGSWEQMQSDGELKNLFASKGDPLPKDGKVLIRIEKIVRHVFGGESKTASKKALKAINSPKTPTSAKRHTKAPKEIEIIDLSSNSEPKNKKPSARPKKGANKQTIALPPRAQNGRVKTPFTAAPGLTVLSLGAVVFDAPKWHTPRFIFPKGFSSLFGKDGVTFKNEIAAFDDLPPARQKTAVAQLFGEKYSPVSARERLSQVPLFCCKVQTSGRAEKELFAMSFIAMGEKLKKGVNEGDSKPPLASRIFGLRERVVTLCIESLEDARLCKDYRLAEINPFDCVYSARGKRFLQQNAFFLAEKDAEKRPKSGDSAGKSPNRAKKAKQRPIENMGGVIETNGKKEDAESDCIVID